MCWKFQPQPGQCKVQILAGAGQFGSVIMRRGVSTQQPAATSSSFFVWCRCWSFGREDVGGRIVTRWDLWAIRASVISVGGLGLSPPALRSPGWLLPTLLTLLAARDWFLVLFEDTCPALPWQWPEPAQSWVGHGPGNISRLPGPDQVRHSETSPAWHKEGRERRACRNNSGVNTLAKEEQQRTVRVRVLTDCDEVEEWWAVMRWWLMTQYSYRSSSVQVVMWRIQIMRPVVLSNQITNGILLLGSCQSARNI